MKPLVKIIIFGLSLSIHPAKAIDLLDSKNTWSVLIYNWRYYAPGLPPVGTEAYLSTWYKAGEDSIKEGKVYKQIMKSRDIHQEQWEFDRLMRKEGEKIYMIEPNREEYLLYDFGMNIGDTIFKPIVDDWEHEEDCVGSSADYSLLCFSYGDELLYSDPKFNECYYNQITSLYAIVSPSENELPFCIIQNNTVLEIRLNPTLLKSGLIQIYSMHGLLLYIHDFENVEDVQIPLSGFPSGWYVISVQNSNTKREWNKKMRI